ncbi:MAG: hypothetical protein AB7E79_00115 [Rhodospirillaceae bacterium]
MKRRSNFFLYALIAVPIGLLIVPTMIVLGVALVPTGVAFLLERKRGFYGGLTVGAMNLAGAAPFLADLWFDGHNIAHAVDIITNVFAWMSFYGAAVFGWAIYSTTPSVVGTFMAMTAGRRIAAMRDQQKDLVQKWGPDVESVYEPEKKPGEAERRPPDSLTNGLARAM